MKLTDVTSARPTHAVSEAEQLLFYSIPGSVFLLYGAIFLFLFQELSITAGLVAGAAAASIPIGFLIYQAYTANILDIYRRINRREKESTVQLIEQILKESKLEFEEDKELFRVSKRILTHIVNKSSNSEASYSWRLIDIVNARGACVFSTILAVIIPITYNFLLYVRGSDISGLWTTVGTCNIVIYYITLFLCGLSLYWGIPKVKAQLDVFDRICLLRNVEEVKKIAEEWRKSVSMKSSAK